MHHRTLGDGHGPLISAVCLGTRSFGSTVDEPTAFAILDRFAEAGGTFVETANHYACWVPGATGDESELLLGRWLRSRRAAGRTVVATTGGGRPDPARGGRWPANTEGLGAAAVRAAIEGSLRRLGIDRVDLYYAHHVDLYYAHHHGHTEDGGVPLLWRRWPVWCGTARWTFSARPTTGPGGSPRPGSWQPAADCPASEPYGSGTRICGRAGGCRRTTRWRPTRSCSTTRRRTPA